jgi:ATP-dependent Lon protease
MARDSVFNATSVLQRITGLEVSDYNIHFNIVGGGSVDGPSAGAALFLALYSAVKQVPLCQDMAVSGELSLQGKIKPVGGLTEKLYGARVAGIKRIILPRDNKGELPAGLPELEISYVDDICALLGQALAEGNENE